MNLQEQISRTLREEISASDAYDTYESIKTIIDGKRNVGFVGLDNIAYRLLVSLKSLKKIKVQSPTELNYIIYREGSENEARELYDIAMKYGGSLSYEASEEDSRRIGQILGYKKDEIEDYIEHNKKLRGITENIHRIQEVMGIKESLISIDSKLKRGGDSEIEKKIESNAQVILMGGLDYRKGDKSINQQVDVVKKSIGLQNVIGHRYMNLSDVLLSIKKNQNAYVILFSAGCKYSKQIADAMSDKTKLFIVEPYAISSETATSVSSAVGIGVPSKNVIVGPSKGRGSGVVNGATKTPSEIGHWGALEYVGSFIK